MFAYCNNRPSVFADSAGKIPKELTRNYFSASVFGGGGSTWGPYIPITYKAPPHSEETLNDWVEKNGLSEEVQLLDAVSDISDGIENIKDGIKLLLLPAPSTADDLWGVAQAVNGVLQGAIGITKFVIWVIDFYSQEELE